MNESELIRLCQAGDEAAFEQLLHAYEKKVYTLCLRLCGNEEDAGDAAQDAFLSMWRSIGSFRQESSLSTWLYRLATNACIDLLRRRKHSAESVSLDDEDTHPESVDPSPTPEEVLERRELQRMVQEGLCAMPEEYRKVLVLREVSGLSYAEISAVTGLEMGTVKSRISRARLALRNYLTVSGNFLERYSSKVTECNQHEKERSAKKQ